MDAMTYALVAVGVLYGPCAGFRGHPLNATDLLAPPAFLLFFGIRAMDEFHLISSTCSRSPPVSRSARSGA